MLHHDQVKTLHSMWGKRWQEHLYICCSKFPQTEMCVFANYRTNPLSRPCKLSFCNCAASPQPAMLPVSCVAGFALNSLNSCRDHMRTTKMQSAISRIFSEPSTIAFRASDCRQAQVGRCSNAFKNIWSCIWTTRHVDPRQVLLQVGGELFVCHLHLSSWAEFVRSSTVPLSNRLEPYTFPQFGGRSSCLSNSFV